MLRELLAPIPDDLRGLRDRALLLVGFAGALRRSELAGILLGDLERTDQGLRADPEAHQGVADRSGAGPPALRQDRALPGARAHRWLDAAGDHRRAGVPAHLAAAAQAAAGAPPLPCPAHRRRAAHPPLDRAASSRRAPPPPDSRRAISAATASSAARSPPACSAAHTPAQLKRLGRHKSFDVLGEYLEFGNLFDGHPLGEVL